jgi:hypothetical protein
LPAVTLPVAVDSTTAPLLMPTSPPAVRWSTGAPTFPVARELMTRPRLMPARPPSAVCIWNWSPATAAPANPVTAPPAKAL